MRTFLLAVTVGLGMAIALPPLALAEGSSCATTASDKKTRGRREDQFHEKMRDGRQSQSAMRLPPTKSWEARPKLALQRSASPTRLAPDHTA